MGIRKIQFIEDEYYHIFNRGVDKRIIFKEKGDIQYFFHRLIDLNSDINFGGSIRNININKEKIKKGNRLVTIIAYCLLPNHFHLVLKQELDNGISMFMQKLGSSYSKYFNQKYERSGSLFQGKFKANKINGNLSLPTVSAYVNLNYKHHNLDIKNNLVKSSVFEYLDKEQKDRICHFHEVLDEIGGREKYKKFLKTQSKYFSERKGIDTDKLQFDELEK